MALLDLIFGSKSEREVKKIIPIVEKIEALEKSMEELSDEELKNKTNEFKKRIQEGETLDDILPEAFAVVREASVRVLGMKQYRVQLIGGIILHQGRIAEMKTGEGKTLVATLPAYLNALDGKGVHIVTVNDYLAKRDKEWMGKVHEFLGLSVGVIVHGLTNEERRENYNCDITYGTNNQFGFDYLRDNMVIYKEEQVQRDLHYAIIDEVDSILIDEARTPLIISGQGDKSTDLYKRADSFVRGLEGRILDPEEDKTDPFDREFKEETVDFIVDEKRKTANLTEQGTERAEKYFGVENLSDPNNMELAHHINQALKANHTMKKDIDYVVKDGEILIVDEFTGRIMEGRRYSDGLHQAIEAKENVDVKSESKTLATITFQNFFRMYNKISGMTGTAKTEEEEFSEIYHMDVVEIPTNKPVRRDDMDDRIYVNEESKFRAIIDEIERIHKTGQPILVGTISIEISEYLSKLLRRRGISHDVLNAKQHQREAEIVAQAGMFGKVTIATNMAGRGTDIILGGNPDFLAKHEMKKQGYEDYEIDSLDSLIVPDDEDLKAARKVYEKLREDFKKETDVNRDKVIEAGGLYILGTERHESRRIDNQLRGRAGRQGDPGASRFFIALEDNLMRLFGGEMIQRFADSGKFPEDEPIESKTVSKAIERAQKRVESNNFAIRKNVLKYDDVMNVQRKIIYAEREKVLQGEDMHQNILEMLYSIVEQGVQSFCSNPEDPSSWEMEGLLNYLHSIYLPEGTLSFENIQQMKPEDLRDYIYNESVKLYEAKEQEIGSDQFREIERVILLMVVDRKWMDHIDAMDQFRQGINLRSFGQQDPVRAYTNEGYEMFEEMNHSIKEDTIRGLFNVEPQEKEVKRKRVAKETQASAGNMESQGTVVKGKKVGRNDPCPCGSGKKYKHCCGR
ncbi:MAG: preprotein translocase subunit SecA [Tissierellia bacterium]|nr:preprotein translocase subunit SecA [Tissierellia bacterium]